MKISLADNFYFRVTKETTLQEICERLGVAESDIIRNNFNLPLYAGEVVKICKQSESFYMVKPLDTIEKLAKEFNLTVEEIVELNGLETDKLFIGQKLKLTNKKATV